MGESSENSEIVAIDERDIEVRYPTNLSMKREARMEYEYFLWLRGKKLREIAEIVQVDITTVWNDLNEIREKINEQPRDLMQIRMETLLSLRLIQQDLLNNAKAVEKTISQAKMTEEPKYNQIKGLYGEMRANFAEAADIDKLILTRYTQPGSAPEVKAKADEQVMAMIDYITEKLGPESMDDFMSWWKGRMAVKNAVQ
jgi:hypothetical protein